VALTIEHDSDENNVSGPVLDTSNDSSLFEFGRHRLSVPTMMSPQLSVLRRADDTKAPLLSESTSAASLTSSDRDIGIVPGPMPNDARLPTGIANIRPHLEQVQSARGSSGRPAEYRTLRHLKVLKRFRAKVR
jgi:hypothetical protein